MNSHKKLVLASLAICAAVVGTVGVAAISNSDGLQAVNIVKADPKDACFSLKKGFGICYEKEP